jgi:hypothetical protein
MMPREDRATNAPSVGFADSSPAAQGSISRSSTATRGRWIVEGETEGAFRREGMA